MSDHPELLEPYDAVLLVSFGGPEAPEEVVPFLANVTRGRGIPPERLAEVGEHYFLFGGRSPINDQCRMLLAALTRRAGGARTGHPAVLGQPQLRAVPRPGAGRHRRGRPPAGAGRGHQRVPVVLLLPAVPGEPVRRGRRAAGADRPDPALRQPPGFVAASVEAAAGRAGPSWGRRGGRRPRLVFVTHSIPLAMARTAGPEPRSADGAYVDWHRVVAAEVTRQVGLRRGEALDS